MNILEQMRAKSQKKEIGEEDKDVVKGTVRIHSIFGQRN